MIRRAVSATLALLCWLTGNVVPAAALADEWLVLRGQSQPDEAAATPAQSASYLQYEPQNSPPPGQGPAGAPVLPPPLTTPPCEPEALPWCVPYGTQFTLSWTSGSGDQLGMTDFDFRQTLVFPQRPGFMVTPGTAFHLLSGPERTDLPEMLYDHWLEFRWLKKLNDRWALDLVVTPSLFTDYENTGSDAVRITGRAIGLWTCTPELQLAMGVIYLDREDVVALPGVGAIWTPSDDYKVEILFPRPRVMRRLSACGDETRWIYVGGEFGGGSWAIQREDGTPDVFTYSALRFLVGYEVKKPKGFAPRVEAGYVFDRRVEYNSEVGNYDPDSAFLLRVGGAF